MQVQDLAEKIIQSILDKHEGTCIVSTYQCILYTHKQEQISV